MLVNGIVGMPGPFALSPKLGTSALRETLA
jgi:hypothetical protein